MPDLIETNRKNFVRSGVSFEVFKSLDDVPNADLLLCKDVFQHLSNDTIAKYLAIFKQRFRILLITNDDQPDTLVNGEIEAGGWRPIRLDRPPFAERAPIVLSWTVTEGGVAYPRTKRHALSTETAVAWFCAPRSNLRHQATIMRGRPLEIETAIGFQVASSRRHLWTTRRTPPA